MPKRDRTKKQTILVPRVSARVPLARPNGRAQKTEVAGGNAYRVSPIVYRGARAVGGHRRGAGGEQTRIIAGNNPPFSGGLRAV